MANTFSRKISRGVGTTAEAVGAYTVAADTQSVLIGLTVSNTHTASVKVNILVDDGVTHYYLVKGASVDPGGALVPVGNDQKMILVAGESLKVSSDAANSIDAILSVLEITPGVVTPPTPEFTVEGDLSTQTGTEDLSTGTGTLDLQV